MNLGLLFRAKFHYYWLGVFDLVWYWSCCRPVRELAQRWVVFPVQGQGLHLSTSLACHILKALAPGGDGHYFLFQSSFSLWCGLSFESLLLSSTEEPGLQLPQRSETSWYLSSFYIQSLEDSKLPLFLFVCLCSWFWIWLYLFILFLLNFIFQWLVLGADRITKYKHSYPSWLELHVNFSHLLLSVKQDNEICPVSDSFRKY